LYRAIVDCTHAHGRGMSSSPGAAPARGPIAGGRVGLSEYTAQRLAELRARRADADTTDRTFGSSSVSRQASGASPTLGRATDGAGTTARPAPALSAANPNPNPSDKTFTSSPGPSRGTAAATDGGGATRPANDVTGLNGLKTESAAATAAAGVNSYSYSASSRRTVDDIASLQTHSTSMNSSHHHHQQQHQYIASSSISRSLSSTTARHPPSLAVDMKTAHQVGLTVYTIAVVVAPKFPYTTNGCSFVKYEVKM